MPTLFLCGCVRVNDKLLDEWRIFDKLRTLLVVQCLKQSGQRFVTTESRLPVLTIDKIKEKQNEYIMKTNNK